MPTGGQDNYFLQWAVESVDDDVLERALAEFLNWWNAQPSLRVHELGDLTITIRIHGVETKVEITDRPTLDRFRTEGASALIEVLAGMTGLPIDEAKAVLAEAGGTVTSQSIRDPSRVDAWKPSPDAEPKESVQKFMPQVLGQMIADIDRKVRRAPGQPRTDEAERLMRLAVRSAQVLKLSDAELARRTNIPRETLRDARKRIERGQKIAKQFAVRVPGRPFTIEQRKIILDTVKDTKGNAAEAARKLGLAERTVREIRSRAAEEPRPRKRYTDADKERLFRTMARRRLTVSETARRLGIPERTARQWSKARRDKELE